MSNENNLSPVLQAILSKAREQAREEDAIDYLTRGINLLRRYVHALKSGADNHIRHKALDYYQRCQKSDAEARKAQFQAMTPERQAQTKELLTRLKQPRKEPSDAV